jgi:hypothetical protein
MAFTTCTLTHGSFVNPDGTPASGVVELSLSKRMTNGTATIVPGSVTAALTGAGALSVAVVSNADAGTVPTDAQWRCDLRIAGAEVVTYWLTVPAEASVDIMSLVTEVDD